MATKGGPIEFANDDMGVHPRVKSTTASSPLLKTTASRL
jgi:hypothetical protein